MDERDKIAEKYGLKRTVGEISGKVYEQWETGKDRLFYVYMHDPKEYRIQSEYYNDTSKTGHINFNELHFTNFEMACQVCRNLKIENSLPDVSKYKYVRVDLEDTCWEDVVAGYSLKKNLTVSEEMFLDDFIEYLNKYARWQVEK